MLGYLAQCRYALLGALRELKVNPGHEISIERFDDIAFEDNGIPIELIQSKHHTKPADVSDHSVDVWKTILIWAKGVKDDPQQAAQTRFVLLTTATASPGSALEMLRQDDARNPATAVERLRKAAQTSTNAVSKKARALFLDLDEALRQLLVENIWVLDRAPNIVNVREEIEIELTLGVPPGKLEVYTDYLEGWWFTRVIAGLSASENPNITLSSLLAKMTEIRDDFHADGLPLSPEIEDLVGTPLSVDDDRVFVRQLRLVEVPEAPAKGAVQDYYRAYTQRSKWAREDLLLDNEADRYDSTLIDAMHREAHACADAEHCVDEPSKKALGRKLFHWSRRHQQPLRNRHEIWLSAGSYQILADRMLIGWHPEFQSLLSDDEQKS
jgi:hypothetical protein